VLALIVFFSFENQTRNGALQFYFNVVSFLSRCDPCCCLGSRIPFDNSFHRAKDFKFASSSLDFHEDASMWIRTGAFYVSKCLPLLSRPAKDRSCLRGAFVYSSSSVNQLNQGSWMCRW
jgi:hypothetical protein